MVDILNIAGEPIFDDRIVKIETYTYANTTFEHSDEIRIPIQQQDLYTLPCDSFLYVEGRLTVKSDQMSSTLGNNCVAFMFDEIRYELNGVEIDRFTVIDCSRQNESVNSATVDVRIEFNCKENVLANTTTYFLIIHDRVIERCPLSNVMRQIM
ncbi:hypothetical protein ALC57_01871 [Trachymyrmex cornetzi]|uniref:Double jelly roll-like domain-containing protein n=1 Tax=Trachymyrmex cornetzi TaxID=471704 RepID=A0A151JPI0_9HYME|nr:hypothetical protein ALC57_01871 [Trachymyrmex cornetzi]